MGNFRLAWTREWIGLASVGALIVIAASLGLRALFSDASPDPTAGLSHWLVAAIAIVSVVGVISLIAGAFRVKSRFDAMKQHLAEMQEQHEASRRSLVQRTSTVDRLLDFSQTIQGVGKPEQVYETLCHFLRTELSLSGLTIIANDPEALPAVNVKASWPENLMVRDKNIGEMERSLCPCLRQNLPRQFRPDGSPVRCTIDNYITLGAAHPALCIPFNVGRTTQVLVHMLMQPSEQWTEERRQVAQTYVNTAHAALISLNLLIEAEKQSLTDPLTGLFNRRSMDSLLEREVALADRHGHPLSIVMIDMDHFKEINDTHGHAAGDYMLKSFADCVRITLRKTDLAFRFGGDEFVIALQQTPVTQAQQVVSKLKQAFSAVDFSDAITHLEKPPTLSVGLAERCKTSNILSLESLLAAADSALYAAKADNRNCVRVYQPPRAA